MQSRLYYANQDTSKFVEKIKAKRLNKKKTTFYKVESPSPKKVKEDNDESNTKKDDLEDLLSEEEQTSEQKKME